MVLNLLENLCRFLTHQTAANPTMNRTFPFCRATTTTLVTTNLNVMATSFFELIFHFLFFLIWDFLLGGREINPARHPFKDSQP
jgi:hypothetical protein